MTNEYEAKEKPCLVNTQQGFSVLYKNRYLYSKYQPKTAVLKYIDGLTLLPYTLILCYAPALGYGLEELLQKMPEGCKVITIDFDEELHALFLENNGSLLAGEKRIASVLIKRPEEIVHLIQSGTLFPNPEAFKRAAIVKMSGGTSFHEELYNGVTSFTDDFIRNNWKNVITLTRMGRLYALDILKNLKYIQNNHNIKYLQKSSVSKPIIVIGAGTSTDRLLESLKGNNDDFFIICVDAALQSLLENGIKPDAVIAVECQVAIEKAYIGAINSGIHMIADLTSRPHVTRLCGGNVSFFLSEYCAMPFMEELKQTAKDMGIPVFPALGSVGLYAVETALYLRKQGTPIYLCGLDFSFISGQTHCKGAPAHTASLLNGFRLKPAGFPGAAFNFSAHKIAGKNEQEVFTDAALSGYGALYIQRYKGINDIFDCAETGMKNPFAKVSFKEMIESLKKYKNEPASTGAFSAEAPSAKECGYINTQKEKLNRLKSILTGATKETCENELLSLIKDCGYLYAHFPDSASGVRTSQDFLNRIRAETDIFLKALTT